MKCPSCGEEYEPQARRAGPTFCARCGDRLTAGAAIGEPAADHLWRTSRVGGRDTTFCWQCGAVRSLAGKNGPCRGRVGITFRGMSLLAGGRKKVSK